ncbi:Membrane-bound lysozyme-inhibitor of c-type lysozyme [Moraxella lacunata]|uniref:Membrane-bound lysozyme-inhibitor of c-type lysozyme n=1 Tax=Moraxella lacunata TaxID=477 RepID=A0A378TUF3_MORLA|nr:MliC family protein [Moraxella lacunata]STZ64251.1 Membrane-bound lysozyme-inhibitor of c-type lysozyme [Moraxella lacunata]
MQKLLIATAVGALVLTGCTTNNSQTIKQPKPQEMQGKHAHKHGDKHEHKHGKKHHHGEITEKYLCEKDGKVTAKYNPDAGHALLTITAPSLGLESVDVEMQPAKSASGMLFVNDVNPESKYEWHTKNKFGALDITTADGTVYSLKCEGTRPMHNHAH